MEDKKKPKISNTEWGLVIGALFTIDLIQIGLDFLAIGVVVNRFVDMFVGMCFAFYLHIRGQSLANPKRVLAILATFAGEMIPVMDALPLWGLDGLYSFYLAKGEATLEKNPVIDKIVQTGSRLAGKEAFTPIRPRKEFVEENNEPETL